MLSTLKTAVTLASAGCQTPHAAAPYSHTHIQHSLDFLPTPAHVTSSVSKVAQRWRFIDKPAVLAKMGRSSVLPSARVTDLGAALTQKGYQVFRKDTTLYAFKGLAGKLGPIGVHIALLMILAGVSLSGFGGWKGAVMCPEGQEFLVANRITPASVFSQLPAGAKTVVTVNDFNIDTRPDGSVAQFYSDLTLRDLDGRELLHKTISVNDPFRWGGVTMYQTDWSLAAVTMKIIGTERVRAGSSSSSASSSSSTSIAGVTTTGVASASGQGQAVEGSGGTENATPQTSGRFGIFNFGQPLNLPLASLEGKAGVPKGAKVWATFFPLEPPRQDGRPPKGISSESYAMVGLQHCLGKM